MYKVNQVYFGDQIPFFRGSETQYKEHWLNIPVTKCFVLYKAVLLIKSPSFYKVLFYIVLKTSALTLTSGIL